MSDSLVAIIGGAVFALRQHHRGERDDDEHRVTQQVLQLERGAGDCDADAGLPAGTYL